MSRVPCPGCGKLLRIPGALAGRAVACPQCKHKFRVPDPIGPLEEIEEEADERISTTPPTRPAKPKKSRPLADDADEPRPRPRRRRSEENEEQEEEYGVESEPSPKRSRPRRRSDPRYDSDGDRPSKRPHRGGLILTLGILSIFLACCPLGGWILGGITMKMASTDAHLMDQGSMRRAGRGMTKAGHICALVGVSLATLNAILGLIFNMSRLGR